MNRKRKNSYLLLGIIIIVALSYYFYTRTAKKAIAPAEQPPMTQTEQQDQSRSAPPADNSPQQATSSKAAPVPAPAKQSQGTYSSGSEAEPAPDILVEQVVFDGKSFVPATVNIKVGDVVIFKNSSQVDFWPASDPHPSHSGYPDFDSGKAIAPGGRFQFQFNQAGSFGYHDHLDPAIKGIVIVSAK